MRADTVLKLGDFAFGRYEVPEQITFGGDQQLAVHQLVGGARVVDAMGRSDMPLSWSGMFLGENARDRARYLDNLRTTGLPLRLEWDQLAYQVVVSHFEADFQRFYKLPYRIACTVVADLATPTTTIAYAGVDQALRDDMNAANTLGAGIADGPLTGLLATLNTAIANVSNFAKATQSVINSVLTPLAAVQARVNVLITSAGNVLGSVTTLGGVLPNNPIAQSAASLLNQVTSMQQMPQLYNLNSVLNRMGANMGTIGTGTSTLTQAGGNLFSAAQKAYGDATAWTALAKANGLKDPQISGVANLIIPTAPNQTGGVLST